MKLIKDKNELKIIKEKKDFNERLKKRLNVQLLNKKMCKHFQKSMILMASKIENW